MFERVEVGPRPKETAPSRLGLLLAEYYEQTANPFFDYARLDGQVHTRMWESADSGHALLYHLMTVCACVHV